MRPLNPLFFEIDELLLSDRDHYFTKQELLESITGHPFRHTARATDTVKGQTEYESLQNAFEQIKKELKKLGLSFEFKNGKDASAGFRYPQGVPDPMAQKKSDHRQMRNEQLIRLIKASSGLLPASWMSDLLAGSQSSSKEKYIIFDQNPVLAHIQWIPTIFNAIEKRQVLQFSYNPGYVGTIKQLLFHPYYIKEYNLRWFVFGYATKLDGKGSAYSICAIDRIIDKVKVREDIEYRPSKTKDFANSYFKDIVGVTRDMTKKPITIQIATNDAVTHNRIMTKPIHAHSQKLIVDFSKDNNRKGIFSITVIPNDELDTLLLGFGAGIEVLSPVEYREDFLKKVRSLYRVYYPSDKQSLENEK